MNLSPNIKSILELLPEKPGVYQHINNEGNIIYVGKAKNLKRRVSSYFQESHQNYKTRQLVGKICDIKYVIVENEQDAFLLENNLIKKYQPYYNILLKDGKSYPSICITREEYPRIFKTRKIDRRIGEYYGPYSFGYSVDTVIELIHHLYPIRTCSIPLTEDSINNGKYKVCLKYHLKKCCGICDPLHFNTDYSAWIEAARKIIKGDAHQIRRSMEQDMYQYAARYEYEKAEEIKQKLQMLDNFQSKTIITNTHVGDIDVFGYDEQDDNVYISMLQIHNGSIVKGQVIEYKKQLDENKEEILAIGIMELRSRLESDTKEVIVPFIPDVIDENLRVHIAISGDKKKLLDLAMQNVRQYKSDRLKQADKLNPDQKAMRILCSLQAMLHLEKVPIWIDSFDNSHIQGTNAVSGCVVFRKGKKSKKDYKRFEIKTVDHTDDYASMREVVRRRYERLIENNEGLPDLIIADGGVGQMNAIREVIEEQLHLNIPVAGLKKNDKHRTQTLLFGFPPIEIGMPVTSEVFRLMVEIQDEVHRFAITYHKKKRSKSQTKSQLDDIQHIGAKTKEKLLQHFGSVRQIISADLTDIGKVIGNHRASIVYDYFHNKISL